MSRKKIYKTVGLDREIAERLVLEAKRDRRSMSYVVENALRKQFAVPWAGEEERQNADRT